MSQAKPIYYKETIVWEEKGVKGVKEGGKRRREIKRGQVE